MDDPVAQFFASPRTDNQSASVVQIEQSRSIVAVICVLAAGAMIAVGVSFHSLGRAEEAVEKARLMERESRILEDDTKYIRAYLSARGINIPANHEEAEQ